MIGVTFGNYHSYNDFDLILSSKSIESPSVKTETIDVPGADGSLDFTEFFGEPKYKNRKLTFNFSSIAPYSEQLTQDSSIKNALHGQRLKIVLDADSDFYYLGRLNVGNWSNNKNIGKLSITADCEPWKYKANPTVVNLAATSSLTISLPNLRRFVSPTITTDAAITIAWTGGSTSLSAGTWAVPDLVLKAGLTPITITGAANVRIEYQEASL